MKTRFTEVKYGIALFTEIETNAVNVKSQESQINDACSWKTIQESYPDFRANMAYQEWKVASLMGMNFALNISGSSTGIEINLVDINGHDCHSNLYSMFMAGALAVFKELVLSLNENGLNKVKEFARIYSNSQNLREMPEFGISVETFKTNYLSKE